MSDQTKSTTPHRRRWTVLFWLGVLGVALGVAGIVLTFTLFLGDASSLPIGSLGCIFGGASCIMVARANRRATGGPTR